MKGVTSKGIFSRSATVPTGLLLMRSSLSFHGSSFTRLPIGGRVKLDPWNDKLDLIKSKPVGTVAEREKMPFEVTPFMPYLMRYGAEAVKPIAASATPPRDPKTGESAPGKP